MLNIDGKPIFRTGCCTVISVLIWIFSVSFHAGAEPAVDESHVTMKKIDLWKGETQLRGVNICLYEIYPELDGDSFGIGAVGPIFTQRDFDELRELGANLVNISYPGLFTSAAPYKLDKARPAYLDKLINMIAGADMFAVITFRSGPGRSRMTMSRGEDNVTDPRHGWFPPKYYNETLWEDNREGDKARKAYIAMCRHMAEHYRGNPILVGYDPLIEPNSNETKAEISEAEEFYQKYAGSSYDWNDFYPEIVGEIRKVDKKTPIMIESMNYGDVDWLPFLKTITDARTVYCIHPYEPRVYTHQKAPSTKYPGYFDADGDGRREKVDRNFLEKYLSPAVGFAKRNKVPLAVTEFGAVRHCPGVHTFLDDIIDILESNGWNYANWSYVSDWVVQSRGMAETACDLRYGPDPGSRGKTPNKMQDTLVKYWKRNTRRPSNTAFE